MDGGGRPETDPPSIPSHDLPMSQLSEDKSPRLGKARSPPGSVPRPPVPKKPPVALVKPLSPRGRPSISPHGSPSSVKKYPGGPPNKVPPPLPKVPPKGGLPAGAASPRNSPRNQAKSLSNGNVLHPLTKQASIESETEFPATEDGVNDGAETENLDSSGGLEMEDTVSFFDEVMSALSNKQQADNTDISYDETEASVKTTFHVVREDSQTESVTMLASHSSKPSGMESPMIVGCASNISDGSAISKSSVPSKHFTKPSTEISSELGKKESVKTPPLIRPKPKKRVSLVNSSDKENDETGKENVSPVINNDGAKPDGKTENAERSKPTLAPKPKAPKPVPRKRLPMPNLSSIHLIDQTPWEKRSTSLDSPTNMSTSSGFDGADATQDKVDQVYSPPPVVPTKFQPRCKGRMSLDTFFTQPNIDTTSSPNLFFEKRLLEGSYSTPLNSSFSSMTSIGDGSDCEGGTPRRPPRPQRMKTLLGLQNVSMDVHTSGSDGCSKQDYQQKKSNESNMCGAASADNIDLSINSVYPASPYPSMSGKKVCPAKPKRKLIPRVNRSQSDVSSTTNFVMHVDSQNAAKENLLNGSVVHSPISRLQVSNDDGSRPRSRTHEALFSPCPATSPLPSPGGSPHFTRPSSRNKSRGDAVSGCGDRSNSPWRQRFNPFNKEPSPVPEEPDFHSESKQLESTSRSNKRPSEALSPIIPHKNNKMPLIKLKPNRRAPPPPGPKGSMTGEKKNKVPPEVPAGCIAYSHDYESPVPPNTVRSPHKPLGDQEDINLDSSEMEKSGSPLPVVPPHVSTYNKTNVLSMTPPPPRAPPRTKRRGCNGELEEDDGYIYPDDVPIEFAASDLWPKSKDLRPQSALPGPVDMTKFNYQEMAGSPMTQSKLKHLSLMSESSSQSDHGSDSPQRVSSFLLNHTSSDESLSGEEGEDHGKGKKNKHEKLYYIAEEIMLSEKVFVDVLTLMNVDFRQAISKATEKFGKPVIPSDTLNRILDFLPQLQNFNEDLLKDLTHRIAHWDEDKRVADIFVKKGPFLKLYTEYIKHFEKMTSLLQESCKKHPAFGTVVREFESVIDGHEQHVQSYYPCIRRVEVLSPRCAGLAVRHYMLKPIQRIPQYKLLLQDYKKHLSPDSPDYKDTDTALAIVSEVANHANESMRYGDAVQKMLAIQHSLIGQFEVIKPGRSLIKEGELLKLSRKEMQPRMFFLFSDVLLYTTPVTGSYKLNNVLSLTSMKVKLPTLAEYKYEFSIISVQRSFTLATTTARERDEWITALNSAIEENALKRSTFDFGRINSQPDLSRDYTLGSKAPVWIPDSRVTMCMLCTGEFTVTWRRHHCRACGKVVCGSCSENKAPLQYLSYKISRVCEECYDILEEELEKDDKTNSLGRAETNQASMDSTDGSGLSIASLKARFQKIRRSARTLRGSGAKKRPAVLKEVHANDQGSTMSGYLRQYKGKKWRKLWFVLKEKVLYTYKASEDMAAIESVPLLGYDVLRMQKWFDGVEPNLVFQCQHKNMESLIFRTESATDTDKWVLLVREASLP